jgi:hypothetical protein
MSVAVGQTYWCAVQKQRAVIPGEGQRVAARHQMKRHAILQLPPA